MGISAGGLDGDVGGKDCRLYAGCGPFMFDKDYHKKCCVGLRLVCLSPESLVFARA